MSTQSFPLITEALVEALQRCFPNKLPQLDTPVQEICARIGEQRVIAFLQRKLQEQQEPDDEPS